MGISHLKVNKHLNEEKVCLENVIKECLTCRCDATPNVILAHTKH